MLREARIVMPYNAARDVRTDHDNLRGDLVGAFGGYTASYGSGAWRNDAGDTVTDVVAIYDVAIEAERDATWDTLFQIAMAAGRELKQEAVYIRYPDGHVEIAQVHGSQPEDRLGAKVPLGGRRLPAVGEIWETSCGDKVAVVRSFNRVIGKHEVVVLTNGPDSPFSAGTKYEIDEDGKVLPDKSSHPRNLKRFVKDF